ncbi:hypothetical protein MKW94_002963 [Papaver nudicaule]|uniref:Fanconi-associated nuclease n=1 Tax=Papaver nudicaule TaxID=74823 RepID=A0AA41W0V4_PAPNU|nr:hypothetical protein [Papaver nudicaule]
MLTGRESLVRLIGKRRKILPDRQSFLLKPPESSNNGLSSSSSSTNGTEIGESSKKTDDADVVVEIGRSDSSYVTCPVCGNEVEGSDQKLNSHLDVCLTRGTKRKLKQPTLFQFSFKSSVTKPKDESSNNLGINDVILPKHENVEGNGVVELPAIEEIKVEIPYGEDGKSSGDDIIEERDVDVTLSVPNVVAEHEVDGSTDDTEDENPSGDDITEEGDVDVTMSVPSVVAKHEVDGSTDDTSVAIFQTFIVGRKFGEEVDLKIGDNVSLSRDQYNVKDPNAIKVLCTDSGCEKVIGYIPRELARYLSPLIEKAVLIFEVSISSLPKRSLDIVPIQVVCQRMAKTGAMESDNHGGCDSVWKDVLHVVEYAKNFIPGKRKYQQNFLLLIQEVMRSHQHLFIDEEKLYIESFESLSEDSQNLFVRLFTRKGPWFRVSNISYQEVSDSQQAIEGLCARGYLCSLESMKEPNGYDMKDILDVLTVSELRDICSLSHSKKGICSSRKQELISLLSTSYEDGKCPSLPSMVLDRTGKCVRVSSTAESLLWRVQRLFFLNGEQDLNAFLMVDLGLVKYPAYTCIVHNQIFPSRADLLAYEEALEVAQIMDESLEGDDADKVRSCIELSDARISISGEATGPIRAFHSSFSDSYIYSKVVTLGISYLERERRYEDAIRLLKGLLDRVTCGGRRGYWTLRLSVDLEHMGRLNESLTVAEEGLLDPWVRAGSKMALQRRILRLGKPPRRWKIPSFSESIKRAIKEVQVLGRPLNCDLGLKSRFYGEDGEQCGVEELALQYYANEGGGWHGVHTESGIWMTIFGLIMWDVIFAEIPDVFHNRFQVWGSFSF